MPGSSLARGNLLYQKLFAGNLSPAPVSVAAATTAEQSFTVQGVQLGDYVNCQCAGVQTAGLSIANVRVTGANTIAIAFNNSTAGALVPVAGPYGFVWGRPESLPLPTDAT
jgi:hypothetical protein